MNKTTQQNPSTNTKGQVNKRPENKDNLDSRTGEEQLIQSGKITNNEKEKHSQSSTTSREE